MNGSDDKSIWFYCFYTFNLKLVIRSGTLFIYGVPKIRKIKRDKLFSKRTFYLVRIYYGSGACD